MAGEPEKPDNGAEWKMPDPVFRSSDGHDPRADAANDKLITGSEDVTEIPEIKMENESEHAAEPVTGPEIEKAIESEEKGDRLGMSMTLVGLLALLGAGIVFLLIYFMFFRQAVPDAP